MGEGKKLESLKAKEREFVDRYMSNGFNGLQAIRDTYGNASQNINAIRGRYNRLMKNESVREYIKEKQRETERNTGITRAEMLRELLSHAYSDATAFIGLSEEEIKELPEEVRRCISSYKVKRRTYTTRSGKEETEETIEIKLVDKTKAIEMINKHIGFYLEDNQQKQSKIDIAQLNVNVLNALLAASGDNN